MKEYHKINTIYKRDMTAARKPLIEGDYSEPEFEFLANTQWIGTEKVDGTNTRVIFNVKEATGVQTATVDYRGKTDDAQFFPGMTERLETLFPLSKLEQYFQLKDGMTELDITLYGETYGPGINKGGNYGQAVDFILFDIKIGKWWLERETVEKTGNDLGIKVVPVIFKGTLPEAVEITKKGYNSTIAHKPFRAEGMILFPSIQLFNRKGKRIITKLKYSDFTR